jgi:DNA-binding MarR family transcriptional regulator
VDSNQDFIDQSQAARQKWGRGIHVSDTAHLARVTRLAALLERELAEICADAGLTAGQFQVLAELHGRELSPMTASGLARAIVLTSGGMTPVLDQLEARGLIRRQIDSEDRRARRITITEKGRSAVNGALNQQITRYHAISSELLVEERETLSAILRKLLLAVEPKLSQTGAA